MLVLVDIVLVLGQPTSPPNMISLVETGMTGGVRNIITRAKNPPSCYLGVGVIHIMLLVIINLVLKLVMVKLVWDLGPPTLPPIKMIVGLLAWW